MTDWEVLNEFLEDNREDLIAFYEKTDPFQLLTLPEVCSLLRISKPTFYRLLKVGKLKQTQLISGKKGMVRFRRVDIENYLLQSTK